MKRKESTSITQHGVIVGVNNIAKYFGFHPSTIKRKIDRGEFGKSLFTKGKKYAFNTNIFWS